MNGTRKQITVSLAVSKRFCIEDHGRFLRRTETGLRTASGRPRRRWHHISVTGPGHFHHPLEADKDKAVYRNGAKETDLMCVSGDLGAAYMGLQLMERDGKAVFQGEKDVQPDFAGKEYLLERFLKPEAQKDIVESLAKAGIKSHCHDGHLRRIVIRADAHLFTKPCRLPRVMKSEFRLTIRQP